MAFLVETDYNSQIRNEVKAVLLQGDGSQQLCEQMAEAEIASYLRARGYDIEVIFSATGAERNAQIIMLMVDITLYHLHSNIVTRAMPSMRKDRYDAAIDWLNRVSKGQLEPNLPRLSSDDQDATPTLKLGSNKRYSRRY
ncbi:phage protein Gp36 family protein [Pedobacter sp. MW01-1-1]|uniref:phage protein Gp36 family protein n=1 Tax=Pedobacter sp. MW01-1-1 TaxID=3383027 RepID=UPI003FEE3F25